jgi:hypothetical protein
MLAAAGGAAAALAALWLLVADGGFRTTFAFILMLIGGVLSVTGSNILSRSGGAEERAMMGLAPENEDPDSGSALAPVGVFLFVSVPLFVVGGLLYGTG